MEGSPVSSQGHGKCLICFGDTGLLGDEGEGNQLENVIEVYFLLRHVIQIPFERLVEAVGLSGEDKEINGRVTVCNSCGVGVKQCMEVYGKMVYYFNKFKEAREGMVQKILEGKEESEREVEWRKEGNLTENCRQFVWRKHARKDTVVVEDGEDFGGEFDAPETWEEAEPDLTPAEVPESQLLNLKPFKREGDNREQIVDSDWASASAVKPETVKITDDRPFKMERINGCLVITRPPPKKIFAVQVFQEIAKAPKKGIEEDPILSECPYQFQCTVQGCSDKGLRINLQKFLAHYDFHKGLNVKCSQCEKLFRNPLGISNHYKRYHKSLYHTTAYYQRFTRVTPEYPEVPWWCPVCPQGNPNPNHQGAGPFSSEHSRAEHMLTNHPQLEYPETCNKCSRQYVTKWELKLHQNTAHNLEVTLPIPSFPCDQCSETFDSKNQLRIHRQKLHKPKTIYFNCSRCQKRFNSQANLELHISGPCSRLMECPQCQKLFSKSQLTAHKRQAHGIDLLQCPECSQQFTTVKLLEHHRTQDHGVPISEQYRCQHCQKFLSSRTKLSEHIQHSHTTPEHSICPTCGKSIKKSYLKDHMFQKHGVGTGKIFPCPTAGCAAQFQRPGLLQYHLQRKHTENPPTFPCSLCDKQFASLHSRKVHLERQHVEGLPYQCQYCDKQFKRKDNHQQHEKRHLAGKRIVSPRKCPDCGEIFRRVDLWRKHQRQEHPPPKMGKKRILKKRRVVLKMEGSWRLSPGICQVCGMLLKNKYTLRNHVKIMHETRDKQCCELCGKELAGKGGLRVHKALVHNLGVSKCHQKRVACEVTGCGKMFCNKRQLELHQSRHEKKPGFSCEFCGKGFYTLVALKRHGEAVHSGKREEKPCKCGICGKGFALGSYLWQHMKTHRNKKGK